MFLPRLTEFVHWLTERAYLRFNIKGAVAVATLGFLFHGEPGCGKTSTIKAIATVSAC